MEKNQNNRSRDHKVSIAEILSSLVRVGIKTVVFTVFTILIITVIGEWSICSDIDFLLAMSEEEWIMLANQRWMKYAETIFTLFVYVVGSWELVFNLFPRMMIELLIDFLYWLADMFNRFTRG